MFFSTKPFISVLRQPKESHYCETNPSTNKNNRRIKLTTEIASFISQALSRTTIYIALHGMVAIIITSMLHSSASSWKWNQVEQTFLPSSGRPFLPPLSGNSTKTRLDARVFHTINYRFVSSQTHSHQTGHTHNCPESRISRISFTVLYGCSCQQNVDNRVRKARYTYIISECRIFSDLLAVAAAARTNLHFMSINLESYNDNNERQDERNLWL